MKLSTQVATRLSALAPLFREAGRASQAFWRAWDDGVKRRGATVYRRGRVYAETVNRYRRSHAAAVAPVEEALEAVRAGSTDGLPTALAALTFEGRFHRSGYLRGRCARAVKRLDWDEELRRVLRGIVLRSFTKAGPEFREIRKWILRLREPGFDADVRAFVDHDAEWVAERARQVIEDYF